MTTAEATIESSLIEDMKSRASGFSEVCFKGFRPVDFQVLKIVLDVAFVQVAKVSDVLAKATEMRIRKRTVASALAKLDNAEMIFPCIDPRTGIECVEVMNFEGCYKHRDIEKMSTLK